MAHTEHHHAEPLHGLPVQEDGVNFSGIVWFVVILTVTTVVCAAIVWGMFRYMAYRADTNEVAVSPLARPAGTLPPGPNLLTDEPANLKRFRQSEDAVLSSYGWVDRNAGTVQIPISRAKELILERGLPVR